MKKKICPILIGIAVICMFAAACLRPKYELFSVTYLDVFDTVLTVSGCEKSEEAFLENAASIHEALLDYHRLFDIYNAYDSVSNLYTVNAHAGHNEIQVDKRIISLLTDAKLYYEKTGGRVNFAMGSVLSLWHQAREESVLNPENAYIPDANALKNASFHTDPDNVNIDEENGTVYISDPDMTIDVGAIAKGWALERVLKDAPEGYLINLGGNVAVTSPKDKKGSPWVIGIQNPDGDGFIEKIKLTKGSAVTSGDYQRTYQFEGNSYHHIIDPDMLYPSSYWRSVTVISSDSGLADALSTALFTLPLEDGKRLAESLGAEAIWVSENGSVFETEGFSEYK
ncbi:MAG: FAD:protein FMN transferase [Clostridia bacterium]|nr:FAD:protein FMN transferase [Clostridia bacterium]MBQ4157549.1 FAD:protein FMN transferase [Clostridia bacterium]